MLADAVATPPPALHATVIGRSVRGRPLRVVRIGDESLEFCGGTHMPRTGLIGVFKVVSQEGVAKGVRRVTAITGRMANETVQRMSAVLDDLCGKFQCRAE